jgi:hypothetical protein
MAAGLTTAAWCKNIEHWTRGRMSYHGLKVNNQFYQSVCFCFIWDRFQVQAFLVDPFIRISLIKSIGVDVTGRESGSPGCTTLLPIRIKMQNPCQIREGVLLGAFHRRRLWSHRLWCQWFEPLVDWFEPVPWQFSQGLFRPTPEVVFHFGWATEAVFVLF